MIKRERVHRKPSMGVALCRRDISGIPQILLVRSRITYSFSGFVFGKYKPWDSVRIAELTGAMTPEEKLLIWSCDFGRLWYHIWQKVPEVSNELIVDTFYQFYINSRAKFERLIQRDNGRRLRTILTATSSGELGWDIPGGKSELKHDGSSETELETAQRELREEAGVTETDYHVLHSIRPICNSFEDDNSTYVRKYYVAWTDKQIDPHLNYTNINQIGEVSAVQWFGLRDMVNIVAQNKCLKEQVRTALTLFKRTIRYQN